MKLRHLHIEDYKMFKDFDISFVDKNDEPLPIIVLAGVNGSGKTSLLEMIVEYQDFTKGHIFADSNITYEYDTEEERLKKEKYFFLPEKIVYFPAGIDDTKKVAYEFVQTFYYFLKEKDYRPSEITEHFHNYMKNIFDGLDIGFKYSHLDKDDNVWFSNGENEKYYYTSEDNGKDKNIFTIDELSTGEKTLLSKIMYLYFKDYKDKIILIDEPELSLHPSWQNKVLKIYENFAKQNNCQIIIATHSPHIIGSAKPEYLRVLKKVDNKIEVAKYTQSYGLEFSQILTNIMGVDYLRTPDVAKKMDRVKDLIVQNKYDSNEFKEEWISLENMLGKNYLDLKLLKLEIASRRKRASGN